MKTAGLRIYGAGEGNTALLRLTGGGERMRRNSTKYTIKISRVPSFSHRKPVFCPLLRRKKAKDALIRRNGTNDSACTYPIPVVVWGCKKHHR